MPGQWKIIAYDSAAGVALTTSTWDMPEANLVVIPAPILHAAIREGS